ncbi:MAG: VCBS repeat-containing protein [Planctomycetes bacterium]|nr:VCBS repeat-containing protein [Planctomycetota bacterium]
MRARGWGGAAVAVVVFVLAPVLAGTAPSRALAGPELEEGVGAEDYGRAGVAIHQTLKALAHAFLDGDAGALGEAFDPDLPAGALRGWRREADGEAAGGVRFERWVPAEDPFATDRGGGEGAVAFLAAWRQVYSGVDEALFKLHLVDQLRRDGTVRSRVRFEVVGDARDGRRLVERGILEVEWSAGSPARRIRGLRLAWGQSASGPGDSFADVAHERGLDFQGTEDPRYIPPSGVLKHQVIRHAVGGAATGDADGDGRDDVFLTRGTDPRLYLNRGDGAFRDATLEAGLGGMDHATAAVFADLDGDGDQDLYVASFYGPDHLFRNEGGARFVDCTADSGLRDVEATAVLAALDADGDGRLDLYLGRYLDARTRTPESIFYTRNGEPNVLFRNLGGMRFEDVSAASGADDVGLTLGVACADYDRDGDQDIYLANDFGRNVLLRNRGDGRFEDVALESGTLAVSAGMSASWGDLDGDGWLDLYVGSIRSNQRWFSQDVNIRGYIMRFLESDRRARMQPLFLDLRKHLGEDWDEIGDQSLAGNLLLRNLGDGSFEDVSDRAGARPQGWFWSCGLFDHDLDGDLDILAADGWITGESTEDL